MIRFMVSRLLNGVFVVAGVMTIVFLLTHLTGDPTPLFLPVGATQEDFARVRKELGLDRPLHTQYLSFMGKAVQGDLGQSLRHGQPSLELVVERLPKTISLTVFSLVLTLLAAVPLGVISAVKRDSAWDTLTMGIALAGQSMPTFWLGAILILLFSVTWNLFPSSGGTGFKALVLPSVTLGAYSMGLTTRMVRSAVLEVLRKDYVRTARAKGLPERVVLFRHVLRTAAIPVVTIVGLQLAQLLGGAIVTEQVFGYPGMARLAIQAVTNRDFPVVQAFVVVASIVVLVVNLLVDLLYAKLDPRIVYS